MINKDNLHKVTEKRPEKENNPIGKIFCFSDNELNFSSDDIKNNNAMKAGCCYVCIDKKFENVKLSAFDRIGDEKEMAVFLAFDKDKLEVIEDQKFIVTTNWWHTQVKLLKGCVVGEVKIKTTISYELKNLI